MTGSFGSVYALLVLLVGSNPYVAVPLHASRHDGRSPRDDARLTISRILDCSRRVPEICNEGLYRQRDSNPCFDPDDLA
jgi:hypothetical protein